MNRFMERSRGVTVQVLDLSELKQEALDFRKKSEPDCTKATIHGGEWAVATKNDGTVIAICTEGVGYDVTLEDPMVFEFHGNYASRDENGEIDSHTTRFDMFPFASATVNPDELLSYPVKEEVDLADFVRRFGDRLENNFWLWFKELS